MKPSNQTPLDVNPSIGLSLSVFVHPAIDLGFGVQSPKTQNSLFSTVMSHAPKCTKCTKTHQGLCLACKNNVTSVTVPNVTGVPNVTSTPNVPKMTKNHYSVPKMCQKATWCTKWCSVPTGVPNVTCNKMHQMY